MKLAQKPIIHGRDHLPGGPDPIPGIPNPGGDDFGGILMPHEPVGFWKLNEQSGTTAHDSSGNENHMEPNVGGSFSEPLWAQAESPLGDVCSLWDDTGV